MIDKDRLPFDQALADTYVGKTILIGLTYLTHAGDLIGHRQLYGVIRSASPDGILIEYEGINKGRSWNMPPMLEAIQEADPGVYRLAETGEEVENPDLLCTWKITKPLSN